VQNYNTLDKNYGGQKEHWDGFDIGLNARLQNGLNVQGGVSTGRTWEDDCNVLSALPEMRTTGGNQRPLQYCERSEPWLTQFKVFGTYTIPTVDVQLSGTYRNVTGTAVNANFPANNAYLATNSTLGRTLSGGAANITLQLLEPNQTFNERRNELDMRIGKVLRFGPTRTVASIDIFNALNNDAVITSNQSFAAFGRPQEILNARVFKVSFAFDF
jgi:hypothetical protein